MVSIEERLDREDWDPAPDDQLIGEITAITVRTGKSDPPKPYPVLVVSDDDGAEHIVSCAPFAIDVIAHRPAIGERVGVRFWGPQPRSDGNGTWDKYTVAFEKEQATEPDWDAMAQVRGMSTGSQASAHVPASWDDGDLVQYPFSEPSD